MTILINLFSLLWLVLVMEVMEVAGEKFPKLVWVYWQSDFAGARMVTKLCLENIRRHAGQNGWQVRFLTADTVENYIIDLPRYRQIFTNAKTEIKVQTKADIIRLFLIKEYGGVWFDINCVLLQGLSWLHNLKNQDIVTNKHGDQAKVLLFAFDAVGGDSRIALTGDERMERIRMIPGHQNWFIAAVPHAQLIDDWLIELQFYLKSDSQQVEAKNTKQKTYLGIFETGGTYLYPDRALQAVLQNKQKQLDKLNHAGTLLNRNYAVHYYSVWTINARDAAYHIASEVYYNEKQNVQYLTQYTQKQLNQSIGLPRYFVKMPGPVYALLDVVVDPSKSITVLEPFDSFLEIENSCEIKWWIVKDSIVELELLRKSTMAQVKQIQVLDQAWVKDNCRSKIVQWVIKVVLIVSILIAVLSMIIGLLRICCKVRQQIHKRINNATHDSIL